MFGRESISLTNRVKHSTWLLWTTVYSVRSLLHTPVVPKILTTLPRSIRRSLVGNSVIVSTWRPNFQNITGTSTTHPRVVVSYVKKTFSSQSFIRSNTLGTLLETSLMNELRRQHRDFVDIWPTQGYFTMFTSDTRSKPGPVIKRIGTRLLSRI